MRSVIVVVQLAVLSTASFCGPNVLGEFLRYTLPGTSQAILLEGKTKVISKDLVEYVHPQFGSVTFHRSDVVIAAGDRLAALKRLKAAANRSGRVEDYLEAAREALRIGTLADCYECLRKAYQIDADHPSLRIPIDIRQRIQSAIPNDVEEHARIRDAVGLGRYLVASSKHYLLLYDSNVPKANRSVPYLIERKLQLLENFYETFFMSFALQGVSLDIPQQRLMAVYFSDEQAFQRYSVNFDPRLIYAGGFWSTRNNVIAFYDQGTTPAIKRMMSTLEELKKQKQMARGTAISQRTAQLSNVFEMLIKVIKEQSDLEIMTHEATHQLAANSGLLPKDRIGLRWVHEGLASYCESPASSLDGSLGGIHSARLMDHRNVTRDPMRSGIKNIVSDKLVVEASTQLEAVEAYGPAWALTHFLISTRPTELLQYYRAAMDLPADATPEEKTGLFQNIFGEWDRIQAEFDRYVADLKTDLERFRDYQAK